MASASAFPFPACAALRRLRENPEPAWVAWLPEALLQDPEAKTKLLGASLGPTPGVRTTATAQLGDSGSSIASVVGHVWFLSRDARGCREVQEALEAAAKDDERRALADELRGHILEATRCPHANHVVQKLVAVLPPQAVQFMIDEIVEGDRLLAVARHKYGCRIVQRFVEHLPAEQVNELVELLLAGFMDLSRNAYGIFVVQNLLRYATEENRARLAALIEEHVQELAASPHGCGVLGAALGMRHGYAADRRRLAETILEEGKNVAFLVETRHGEAVINGLLDALDGPGCQRLLASLEGNAKLESILQLRSEEEGGRDWCSEQ